jgi:dephospho-CoA kinase
MKVIGLTGNMGTGKSTVLKLMDKYRFTLVVNSDEVSRSILFHPGFKKTVEGIFGDEGFTNGSIDLKKLGNLVFSSDAKKDKLEKALYPLIWCKIQRMINEDKKHDLIVVEAAMLYEKKWDSKFDRIIVTDCSRIEQLRRLTQIRGRTITEIAARLRHQMPQKEKVALGDFVINTECNDKELTRLVRKMHYELYNGLPRKGALHK